MRGTDACVLLSLEFLAGGPAQGDAGPGDAGREHGFALRRALQPAQLPQAAPEGQSRLHYGYGVGTGGFGALRWEQSAKAVTWIRLLSSLGQ